MKNIQFTTKENAITVKDNWTGKDTLMYVPNFDELIRNASCEEEIKAIKEVEERIKSNKFKGFTFQIVYMSYEKALDYNRETKKQEWVMKWQMMQYPWIRTEDGIYNTKEQMIQKIEAMYK